MGQVVGVGLLGADVGAPDAVLQRPPAVAGEVNEGGRFTGRRFDEDFEGCADVGSGGLLAGEHLYVSWWVAAAGRVREDAGDGLCIADRGRQAGKAGVGVITDADEEGTDV